MKAIDRAAHWTHFLEQVGFDIECETRIDEGSNEYLVVRAEKDGAYALFMILMNTPRTRFITGSTGSRYVSGDFTTKPSQMSSWVSSAVGYERFRMDQEVSA